MRLKESLCPAQVTGASVTPFNVLKQTALLSEMARVFPRLAIGVGPEQTRVVGVIDDAAAATATVTLFMSSTGDPQAFAQVCCDGPSLPVLPAHQATRQSLTFRHRPCCMARSIRRKQSVGACCHRSGWRRL